MFGRIAVGSRVTIKVYAGKNMDGSHDHVEKTGRAVMRGPAGWVLDMGGRYGTPGIATPENVVKVNGSR